MKNVNININHVASQMFAARKVAVLLDMSFKLPVNKQHVTKCVTYSLGAVLLQGLIGKIIANECFYKPA
jgi:heme A synthase